jgi:hypothetical protein
MKKPIIRFTTKQGYTARPDIRAAGGWDFLQRVAREALAIHHADAYTYSIEKDGRVRHFSADHHHEI